MTLILYYSEFSKLRYYRSADPIKLSLKFHKCFACPTRRFGSILAYGNARGRKHVDIYKLRKVGVASLQVQSNVAIKLARTPLFHC